jgi:hypothetical protein
LKDEVEGLKVCLVDMTMGGAARGVVGELDAAGTGIGCGRSRWREMYVGGK